MPSVPIANMPRAKILLDITDYFRSMQALGVLILSCVVARQALAFGGSCRALWRGASSLVLAHKVYLYHVQPMLYETQNTHFVGVCFRYIGNCGQNPKRYIIGQKDVGKVHFVRKL